MEKYVLNYLREHSDNELVSKYIEMFKNDLDTLLYGNNPSFKGRYFYQSSKYNIFKSNLRQRAKSILKPSSFNYSRTNLKNVLSTMYFATPEAGFFQRFGIRILSSPIRPLENQIIERPLIELRDLYYSMLRKGSYCGMLNVDCLKRMDELKDDVAEVLKSNEVKALFVGNDEEFCNKYLIEVCSSAGIPTFEFLHGLPGVYTKSINNRTDYLCVWGDKIKDNYVQSGFDAERILVTGSLRFAQFKGIKDKLRNSFDDVLVAPSGACLWIQHGWVMDEHGDQNDSLLILYIYQVENVLKQLGVKHARLRPHQTVDKQWVTKYIDNDFYQMDNESVNDSLGHSTMVIGPHSTLILDALTNGVNYYVFDPGEDGYTIRGAKIVPPFEGKDGYVKVAQTEEELIDNIHYRTLIDPRFLSGYLVPLDLSPINGLF